MSAADLPPVDPPPAPGVTEIESPTALKIPSLSRRVVIGGLRGFLVLLAFGILPFVALGVLSTSGLSSGFPRSAVLVVAIILAVLSAAAYIARPTKWLGPISAVASSVSILYLLYLAPMASLAVHAGGNGSISIEFGRLLEVAALIPLFGLLAALVITYEDFAHPGERVAYSFAAQR